MLKTARLAPGRRRGLLLEVDDAQYVRGNETADLRAAVDRGDDMAVRAQQEAGRLHNAPPLLPIRAGRPANLHSVNAAGHRERDLELFDQLPGIGLVVDRGRNDGGAFLLEIGEPGLEVSQLLTAVRSPVAAIEENHAPLAGKGCGQIERAVRKRAHGSEPGKRVARIKLLRLGLGHLVSPEHVCAVRHFAAGAFFFFFSRPGRVLP